MKKPGDRIAYVFIETKKKVLLQSDRVETPEFVMENKGLKLDYRFYIESQIKNPISQIFALVVEKLLDGRRKAEFHRGLRQVSHGASSDAASAAIEAYRKREVDRILFDRVLRATTESRGQITFFFKK